MCSGALGSGEALLDSLFDFSSALWALEERQRSRNGVCDSEPCGKIGGRREQLSRASRN